jgi:hypothetical protein
VGAVFARLDGPEPRVIWKSDELMSSQYTTCISHEGNLYGIHGRQDIGDAALRCFNPKTRAIGWTEEGLGYATLIKADGKLLIVKTDGTAVLAALDPRQFRELARSPLLGGTIRALPALSNGMLYVRNETTLSCFQLPR